MASLSAARYNNQCHILYDRLLEKGKAGTMLKTYQKKHAKMFKIGIDKHSTSPKSFIGKLISY